MFCARVNVPPYGTRQTVVYSGAWRTLRLTFCTYAWLSYTLYLLIKQIDSNAVFGNVCITCVRLLADEILIRKRYARLSVVPVVPPARHARSSTPPRDTTTARRKVCRSTSPPRYPGTRGALSLHFPFSLNVKENVTIVTVTIYRR